MVIHIKDWTGNSKAVYSTLAASNHSDTDRENNDYYATPPKAVEELLKREKFNHYVWECAVGGGHISEILKQNGYDVKRIIGSMLLLVCLGEGLSGQAHSRLDSVNYIT